MKSLIKYSFNSIPWIIQYKIIYLPEIFTVGIMTSLTKFVCFEVDNEFDIIAFVRSANVLTLSKVCQVISQIPSTKTWSHFSNIATLYT